MKVMVGCTKCGTKILYDSKNSVCSESLSAVLKTLGISQDGEIFWHDGDVFVGKQAEEDSRAFMEHDLGHTLADIATYSVLFYCGGGGQIQIEGKDPVEFDGQTVTYADALANAIIMIS